MWSMGCIILEFMIWLLYGWAELLRFQSSFEGFSVPTFYQIRHSSDTDKTVVHSTMVVWMGHMTYDHECSEQAALGGLLRVVREMLLEVSIPSR